MSITAIDEFNDQFAKLLEHKPFRWQARLFHKHFLTGDLPAVLDLPTGLGKTSVMAIWYLALKLGGPVPRRLVYVVDRRAVVDQATTIADAIKLRSNDNALSISTLRGQYVDNRAWLADPGAPAIIVGTVDMIGSRLLFCGYGVSLKMRPYHAGLLGADTLVVLDESHLVPPFERLLHAITQGVESFGPRGSADRETVPAFRLMPLSATGRANSEAFHLQPDDREDKIVAARLGAAKKLTIASADSSQLAERLTNQAWALCGNGTALTRCVVYCDRREDAEKVKGRLDRLASSPKKGDPAGADTELFVGARRVRERETAKGWLQRYGFLAGSDRMRERPAILIATSAGEVGVDLDADHMVCDLVPWERMVQRLGRVNRRGERKDTEVQVIDAADAQKDEQRARTRANTRALMARLPEIAGGWNASPDALLAVREAAGPDAVKAASTPEPLRPALTRTLVDAWSMTSLEKHTGRPDIDPWLRGWIEDDPPQTAVVWRTYLPVRTEGGKASDREVEDFFEAALPHISEVLETETWRVVDWLMARAGAALTPRTVAGAALTPRTVKELPEEEAATDVAAGAGQGDRPIPAQLKRSDIVAFALSRGDLKKYYPLGELADKRNKDALRDELIGVTLIVSAQLRGLKDGSLNAAYEEVPPTADNSDDWLSPLPDGRPAVCFRVHAPGTAEVAPSNASDLHTFATKRSEEAVDAELLFIETWTTEDSRSASSNPQLLGEHQFWTERQALEIADAVGLGGNYRKALAIAARLHDEGKRADRWQRAFCAPRDGTYAKTKGPLRHKLLDGYRHEFGSLTYVEKDQEFLALSGDLRDLVLHLVAAHHGFARPVIETRGCDDAPPSALAGRARDVALRFARLQKQWGPWGLAWWEALLRAADAQASRENDERANGKVSAKGEKVD